MEWGKPSFSKPDSSLLGKINSIQELFDLFFRLSKVNSLERGFTTPPEYLYHVIQVALTSGAQIETINKNDDVSSGLNYGYLYEQISTLIYAFVHDIGSAVEMGANHTRVGEYIAETVGFDSPVSKFTVDHHHFGLSIRDKLKGYILNKINGTFTENKSDYVAGVLNGEKDIELEKILKPMTKFFLQRFGVSGATVLIADSSKTYTDKDNPFVPKIAMFNQGLAKELISNQIDKGRYVANSDEALVEAVGTRFILYLIKYLTEEYGLDYERAIEKAKEQYQEFGKQFVQDNWQETISRNCDNVGKEV